MMLELLDNDDFLDMEERILFLERRVRDLEIVSVGLGLGIIVWILVALAVWAVL
jgi:hypothetical protein